MAPYGNNFTRLGTGPGTERNSMTGDNTINVLLETFHQCRQRGDWATLSLETRNGEEYATFKIKVPSASANGSPGANIFRPAAKKKSPSRVQRDKKRLETFMTGKRVQESLSPKTPVTPSTKFQAWNTPALDKEENTTFSETTSETSKNVETPEARGEDEKENGMTINPLFRIENWEAVAKHYTLKLMESQNNKHIEDIEERLDNEDVTNWAVRQKQSMINK